MSSYRFMLFVHAIEDSLDKALPRIREIAGEEMTKDELRKICSTKNLMDEAMRPFHRDTRDLAGRIVDLYQKQIKEQESPSYLGENI